MRVIALDGPTGNAIGPFDSDKEAEEWLREQVSLGIPQDDFAFFPLKSPKEGL